MEDEETGELFLPCRVCSHKCYKIHGKHHEKELFNGGSTSFFKVMLGDFADKLRIPPAFVSQLINEKDKYMVLQGPGGKKWEVELMSTNNKLEFRYGWKEFVNYYSLQFGDFVVFNYIAKWYLDVHMFERSECVKSISALHVEKPNIDSNKRCRCNKMCGLNQSLGNRLLIDLVSDEESNHESEAVAENRRSKRKSSFLRNSSKDPAHCVSSDKHMAMESAAFNSDKPFFSLVMKSWNINKPYMLAFPVPGKNPIRLPNQKSEVVLLDGELKEWKVQCIIKEKAHNFSGGWRSFVLGNNIKEGDKCIFEQLNNNQNKFMFRVHIFRA